MQVPPGRKKDEMKTITVKSQAEFDALPKAFEEFTVIEMRASERITIRENQKNSRAVLRENSSAELRGNSRAVLRENSRAVLRGNSSAVLRENSSAELRGNSRAVLWENSRAVLRENSSAELRENGGATAYEYASLTVRSNVASIGHLADYSSAKLIGVTAKIEKQDSTATVINCPADLGITFETWLERGYVVADGITRKLISKKKKGDLEIFSVENFQKRTTEYVVKRGSTLSHGETIKQAIADLEYKVSDRDTAKYKDWTLKTKATKREMIEAYHAITGACSLGIKSFCEGKDIPEKLTVANVVKLTKGQYGNDTFSGFKWKK
jgi:hypothetical protein